MTELVTTVQNSSDEELEPCPFSGGPLKQGRMAGTCRISPGSSAQDAAYASGNYEIAPFSYMWNDWTFYRNTDLL